MKKHLLIIGIGIAIAMLIPASPYIEAFFTDIAKADNSFTVGGVTTEIYEELDKGKIEPGKRMLKRVSIHNTDTLDCRVRARVLVSPEKYRDVLDMDIDTVHWEERNGWYYYKDILQAGGVTYPIFTHITVPSDLKSDEELKIEIYQEAINADSEGI